jgi:ATP-dependent DNA helicase RecQ
VGFQEPIERIASGTIVRVSLAHWWRPKDRPEDELRCHVQLSGWLIPHENPAPLETRGCAKRIDVQPEPALSDRCPDLESARETMKRVFGYAEFLPFQEGVIRRVLKRDDTLVVMPTGGGKSLCYQLPALVFEGLTVVVSPLIALMQDQVQQLRQYGVEAAFLNSTLSHAQYVAEARRVRTGEVRLLYVAPETLLRPETLLLLDQSRMACLAVDEAHCISEWGHDFRPEYRQIRPVRDRFPQAVCVALTATATPRVRADIRRVLGIDAAGECVAAFDRPNLFLGVELRQDGLGQTLAFLDRHRGEAGIIYCSTRKQVDDLAAELAARGGSVLPYHAGLAPAVRTANQDRFLRDDATVMVATVAFGLGVNKSNVRFVLHYQLPKDIESYYQEIGRAGRDRLPAECLLLHSRGDVVTIRRFIDEGAESERPGRQARLDALVRYAETAGCRRPPLLGYFGEAEVPECGHCDNCLRDREPADLVEATEAARQLFECVRLTGQVFGLMHLIDVLRGSQSRRVLDRSHDRLSVYGAGRERPKDEWRNLGQQCIEQGLLEQDLEFGGLRLTAKGRRVFEGEPVRVRRSAAAKAEAESRARSAAGTPAGGTPGAWAQASCDAGLFEELRRLRRRLADAANVPAYIVFSDRALVEMATHRPQDAAQFLAINGVGEAKLKNYGDVFIETIRRFPAAQGVQSAAGPTLDAAPAPDSESASNPEPTETRWLTATRRFEQVSAAFEAGRSIGELTAQYGVKVATVVEHLARYVAAGGRLDAARLEAELRIDPAQRQQAIECFERLGMDRLGPVHEALEGRVKYDDLHLLRLWLRCRQPTQQTAMAEPSDRPF